MKFEYEAGPSGDVRKRGRTEAALSRGGDDALVDLDGGETGREPVAFGGESGNLFFEFGANIPETGIEDFFDFTGFELLGLFEATLFLGEGADLVGVNAFEAIF